MEKSGFQWKNENVGRRPPSIIPLLTGCIQALRSHFTALVACLDDAELPVRVQAALALTEMVTQHESGAH